MTRFDPRQVGWRLGKAHEPRGGDLWCQAHGNSVTIAGPTVTSFEATLFLPT